MKKVLKSALKKKYTEALAVLIGFKSLDDKNTIITKQNLVSGIHFLNKNKVLISTTFGGYVQKRLLKKLVTNPSDVIKVFRMMLRDNDIQKAIHSNKQSFFTNGKHVTIYSYRLLH